MTQRLNKNNYKKMKMTENFKNIYKRYYQWLCIWRKKFTNFKLWHII